MTFQQSAGFEKQFPTCSLLNLTVNLPDSEFGGRNILLPSSVPAVGLGFSLVNTSRLVDEKKRQVQQRDVTIRDIQILIRVTVTFQKGENASRTSSKR